jgi:hypothetical protein
MQELGVHVQIPGCLNLAPQEAMLDFLAQRSTSEARSVSRLDGLHLWPDAGGAVEEHLEKSSGYNQDENSTIEASPWKTRKPSFSRGNLKAIKAS